MSRSIPQKLLEQRIMTGQIAYLQFRDKTSVFIMIPDEKTGRQQTYQLFLLMPLNRKLKYPSECQQYCDHKLRRIHLSCIRCRIRAVLEGRMPQLIPVAPAIMLIPKDTNPALGKIIKTLTTISEFLMR
jgi:hypothetical protein